MMQLLNFVSSIPSTPIHWPFCSSPSLFTPHTSNSKRSFLNHQPHHPATPFSTIIPLFTISTNTFTISASSSSSIPSSRDERLDAAFQKLRSLKTYMDLSLNILEADESPEGEELKSNIEAQLDAITDQGTYLNDAMETVGLMIEEMVVMCKEYREDGSTEGVFIVKSTGQPKRHIMEIGSTLHGLAGEGMLQTVRDALTMQGYEDEASELTQAWDNIGNILQ